jgi:hypothetical protein
MRTNMDRAQDGLRLCELMENMTGVDERRFQVADALCQLMHLCRLITDEEGEAIDFEEALTTARINFDAEVDEGPDDVLDGGN